MKDNRSFRLVARTCPRDKTYLHLQTANKSKITRKKSNSSNNRCSNRNSRKEKKNQKQKKEQKNGGDSSIPIMSALRRA
eukprot:gene423-1822_t